MKTLSLLIFLTIILFPSTDGFAQWYVVDSSINIAQESVFFTDANTGYVAGYIGNSALTFYARLKKTTNAGISWSFLTIPPADTGAGFLFRSVFFTDINTGYVVGGYIPTPAIGGVILKTTNGGNSWSPLPLPVYPFFDHVYWVNSSIGFVSGYQRILRTLNGGANWDYQSLISGYLFQICFTNVSTGYVIGNGGFIFKTTDTGTTWIQLASGTGLNLWGIGFADANTGFAVGGPASGANVILKTTNAGSYWYSINYSSNCVLWSVRFISPTTGYITGWCNQIIKTTDGGASWCNQFSPVNFNPRSCFFTSSNTGYLVGDAVSTVTQGYILKTTNGGGICVPNGIEPVTSEIPKKLQLYQNYPNPFNPTTSIKFELPKSSSVKLIIYDILGNEIAVLVNEQLKSGSYEVEWNASNNSSGVYFYKLTAEGYTETKKMLLVK